MTRRSKTMKERTYYSTRGRTTFQRTMNYDERFYDHIMTMKQQDILGTTNIQFSARTLLVARVANIHQEICPGMWNLPTT